MRGGRQGDFGCFMFVIFNRNDFVLSTSMAGDSRMPASKTGTTCMVLCIRRYATMPTKVVKLIVTETFVIVHITYTVINSGAFNVADSHQ